MSQQQDTTVKPVIETQTYQVRQKLEDFENKLSDRREVLAPLSGSNQVPTIDTPKEMISNNINSQK